MIPLRDINPTAITSYVTLVVIAVNAYVFFFVQPPEPVDVVEEFYYRNAAIACELATGDPLDTNERLSGVCVEEPTGPQDFPDKPVYPAAVVSMFLHGGLFHLLGNMWFLWIFGNNVEEAYGHVPYLLVYLGAGIAATAAFVLLNQDSTVPLVGASGAVAGIMGAYLVLFPLHRILTIFFFTLVAVPAVLFLGAWLLGQFALVGAESGIAWEAHVFGFLFGIVVTLPLRVLLLRRTASVRLEPFA